MCWLLWLCLFVIVYLSVIVVTVVLVLIDAIVVLLLLLLSWFESFARGYHFCGCVLIVSFWLAWP